MPSPGSRSFFRFGRRERSRSVQNPPTSRPDFFDARSPYTLNTPNQPPTPTPPRYESAPRHERPPFPTPPKGPNERTKPVDLYEKNHPMAHVAEQLKEKGNAHFKKGEYASAETFYSQAIQKYSKNPVIYTNRANARLKLENWEGVIEDCLRSIELLPENLKAYYNLAQAQLALHQAHTALSSALRAYELCTKSKSITSNAGVISQLVLKCKRIKWENREHDRLRRRSALLAELEDKLEADKKSGLLDIDERVNKGEMGKVEAEEERQDVTNTVDRKIQDLQSAFAISDPANMEKREVPDYIVDNISFEIMHDPVITKTGHSYERATLIEHLKRSPYDPLTREPLRIDELRPNVALRQACEQFLEENKGWVYDW